MWHVSVWRLAGPPWRKVDWEICAWWGGCLRWQYRFYCVFMGHGLLSTRGGCTLWQWRSGAFPVEILSVEEVMFVQYRDLRGYPFT